MPLAERVTAPTFAARLKAAAKVATFAPAEAVGVATLAVAAARMTAVQQPPAAARSPEEAVATLAVLDLRCPLCSRPVGVSVGPVFRGSATVAELSMTVAFRSGRSLLVGLSEAVFRSMDVARIVAFGSKVCGAINNPPSNVQNF